MRTVHRKGIAVTYVGRFMSTDDFIIGLFVRMDSIMGAIPKHPQAQLCPSEVVTFALLFARKIVGAKLAYLVNQYGLIVAWDYAAANVADNAFRDLIADFQDRMVVLTAMAFHSQEGDPPNQKACKRGTWNVRMVVETVLPLLTRVCHLKHASQRSWGAAGTAGLHHGPVQHPGLVGRNTSWR